MISVIHISLLPPQIPEFCIARLTFEGSNLLLPTLDVGRNEFSFVVENMAENIQNYEASSTRVSKNATLNTASMNIKSQCDSNFFVQSYIVGCTYFSTLGGSLH